MSPSFALESVIELSAGVNDLITSAEKSRTGGAGLGVGGCPDAETLIVRKISTGIEGRLISPP
jgi:hypothetical protein